MGLRSANSAFGPIGTGQWNEIIYTKIAVMGDSLSAQWPLFPTAWPNVIQDRLNDAGARVEVRTFSTGSHTFHRANTTTTYGSNTAVQAVIAYKPDVVIVELGGNDAIDSITGAVDGRTLTQIQADADDVYAALLAGLPSALLVQLKFTFYDTANFTTSNTKNKGIIPRWMTPKSSGILNGLHTSEYLDDTVSSTNRSILDDYATLQTHIDTISGVEVITVDLFKIERLGVTMVDRIHLTKEGQGLLAGDVLKQLRANAAFTAIVPIIATQLTGNQFEGEDVEALFDDYLVASGDAYVDNTPGVLNGEDTNSAWGINARSIHTDNWFMDYKPSCVVNGSTFYNSNGPESLLAVFIDNAAPLAAMTYSIDGASFAASGYTTDFRGRILGQFPLALLALSNAAHTFRFKVGNVVFDPFTITMAASIIGNVNTTAVGNVGAGEDNLITFSVPAGILAAAGRVIRVVQSGSFANTAAAKTHKIYFGATAVNTGGFPTNLAGTWHCEWWAASTGTDAQLIRGLFTVQTTSAPAYVTVPIRATTTEDDGAAIVIKCTGTATNNDDIIQDFQRVYYE
jgi:lysophospholipase L1-like esterase